MHNIYLCIKACNDVTPGKTLNCRKMKSFCKQSRNSILIQTQMTLGIARKFPILKHFFENKSKLGVVSREHNAGIINLALKGQ